MFEHIYNIINYYLTTYVKDIKSIDLYFDQFNQQFSGASDNMPNPRVLIEIQEGASEQRFGNYQISTVPVVLYIGIDIFETFERNSKIKNKNFAYLSLIDDIFVKINQLTSFDLPDNLQREDIRITNVERTNFLMASNPENIKVSTITFQFIVEDYRTDKNIESVEYIIEDNDISVDINN
jgi:hypothetical protein